MKTAKEIIQQKKYERDFLKDNPEASYFTLSKAVLAMEEYASQFTSPVAQPVTDEEIETKAVDYFLEKAKQIGSDCRIERLDAFQAGAKWMREQSPQPTKIDWEEVENEIEEIIDAVVGFSSTFGSMTNIDKATALIVALVKKKIPNGIQNNGYTREQMIGFVEYLPKQGIKESAAEGMWLIMKNNSDMDIKKRITTTELLDLYLTCFSLTGKGEEK